MKRLCFGTLMSILYQARNQKVTNNLLCDAIFSSYAQSIELRDGSLPGHLKSGRDNVPPDVIAAARDTSFTDNGMQYEVEFGELTEERKQKIADAIIDGVQHGYDIKSSKHRYFFVEKFYETDFKKITPRAPMGTRVFDLTQVLETGNLPETQEIAELLKTKTWS